MFIFLTFDPSYLVFSQSMHSSCLEYRIKYIRQNICLIIISYRIKHLQSDTEPNCILLKSEWSSSLDSHLWDSWHFPLMSHVLSLKQITLFNPTRFPLTNFAAGQTEAINACHVVNVILYLTNSQSAMTYHKMTSDSLSPDICWAKYIQIKKRLRTWKRKSNKYVYLSCETLRWWAHTDRI